MEAEVAEISGNNLWAQVYAQIRRDSMNHDFTTLEASKPENRLLNRYRDVYPYDHSRVVLEDTEDTDYINASLVKVPRANRKYILAQGPLPATVGHFWLTVWQRNSKAVLMLNRVIEKGQLKCHQYWPVKPEDTLDMDDVNLTLKHVDSKPGQHYTVRTLRLTNQKTEESREILHFHYTTWPDFGVPQCPDSFLEFLHAVRDSGSLDEEVGPAVVHCSAGIGRSGTFCLVDTCLVLIAKEGPGSVVVKEILMELRNYRMGLIQTPDQLKFSYLAIVEGARQMGLISADALSELSRPPASEADHSSDSSSSGYDDNDDDSNGPPPLPPPRMESLKSQLNGAREAFEAMSSALEVINGHESSNSSSEATPAAAEQNKQENKLLLPPVHQRLVASVSAPPQPFREEAATKRIKTEFVTSSSTASPTKCILNNHKMEERKREMELRRRKKEEKKVAMETQLQEMKKKAKESEEWSKKKEFIFETIVPFCVGLAMLLAGSYYYMRS